MNRYRIVMLWAVVLAVLPLACAKYGRTTIAVSPYPDGRNFAFTVTDDPDGTRLEKAQPMYECLNRLGFKTTIACWVYKPAELDGMPDPDEQYGSDTLANPAYAAFLREYQEKGFEIALHTVTAGHDRREVTAAGYERIREYFGQYPKINIMHSKNRENIYWGKQVFTNPLLKPLVRLYDTTPFSGEDPRSPYFWGDICREKTRYVRLWGTSNINTLRFNPSMPYHDPGKPHVNYWFSFSDGYSAKYFNKLVTPENIARLVRERGACIAYVHFAASFCQRQADGTYKVNDTTRAALDNIARQKEGWFVPASVLLDRLLLVKQVRLITRHEGLTVRNENNTPVAGTTLIAQPGLTLTDASGNVLYANEDGELMIGDLAAHEERQFKSSRALTAQHIPATPSWRETAGLIWGRIEIMIFEHRG